MPAALEALLRINPPEGEDAVAAVILEPIQGEAGVIVPPPGYLRQVRDLCTRYGVLLILDEIQTGFCRTGTFFACEHEQVVPDLMALAKSLGGGLASIGATVATTKVFTTAYDNPHDCLVQTSTFGGRTTCCAAALAALEVYEEEQLSQRAATLGERLMQGLQAIKARHPHWIREVRGRGLMVGIEFDAGIVDQARYLPAKIPGFAQRAQGTPARHGGRGPAQAVRHPRYAHAQQPGGAAGLSAPGDHRRADRLFSQLARRHPFPGAQGSGRQPGQPCHCFRRHEMHHPLDQRLSQETLSAGHGALFP